MTNGSRHAGFSVDTRSFSAHIMSALISMMKSRAHTVINAVSVGKHRRNKAPENQRMTAIISVSTKYVHGLWITMWMNHHLLVELVGFTHCLIRSHRKLCIFNKMGINEGIQSSRGRHYTGKISQIADRSTRPRFTHCSTIGIKA